MTRTPGSWAGRGPPRRPATDHPRAGKPPARGPPDLPVHVHQTTEQPPGGGPVAATAAGLALIPENVTYTALLAADLPLLTGEAIDVLRLTVESAPMQGAVYRDAEGRRQMLCGVWKTAALRA